MSRHVIFDSEGNDITDEYFKEDRETFKPIEAKPAEEIFDDDPKMSCRETVLDEARRCICQDRQNQYGAPEDSFMTIAALWEVYLQSKKGTLINLKAEDVAMMMVLLKIARTIGHTHHVDNYVDMAGYAALGAELSVKDLR